MIRNYLLITLRNLRKNKTWSFINIAGLSVGLSCTLLILLWVFDELSYDHFLPKSDRLFQIQANVTYDGRVNTWGSAPLGAYTALKTEDSRIANVAIAGWGDDHLFAVGERRIRKTGRYVSSEFLSMFEFPLISGNRALALSDPGSIVITESLARSLFGNRDPMNQIVRIDNQHDQKVTGVLKDLPDNSTLEFDGLLPWGLNEINDHYLKNVGDFDRYSFAVFVELDKASNRDAVQRKIEDLPARKQAVQPGTKYQFFLYPYVNWRLYSRYENGVNTGGAIDYVKLFSVIAAFILGMACINFMNLATARSEQRAKEVGIRKSVGSGKRQLIVQFIGESVLISVIAFLISLVAAQLLLPFYNSLVQKHLAIPYGSLYFWLVSAAVTFTTGLLSGSYPAFYLSAFRPVQVLKGRVMTGSGGTLPRKILVTVQSGFSVLLILGTLVIWLQVKHVMERDLGYKQENLITIRSSDDISKNYEGIKHELLTNGTVVAVTQTNNLTSINSYGFLNWPGKPNDERVLFADMATGYDFTTTLGIKLQQGRDFDVNHPGDTASLLINAAALKVMGLKDPIGQQLSFPGGKKRELIGVIDDVVMGTATETIFPMFIEFNPKWASAMTLRLASGGDVESQLKEVETVFRKFNPAYPFEYSFVDADFEKKFTDISLIGKLSKLFSVLAIFITGLGLFGLASFTAERRIKEMGIRKVLGASVTSLVRMIAQDFGKLVIVSFVIASPPAWWMLNKFLERYSYRIDIPWWIFPLTGITALLFAMLTVSGQAIRAAVIKPVDSLRNSE